MNYTFEEIVEKLAKAMQEMSGDELADLANAEFDMDICYEGDSIFKDIEK